MVEIPVTAAGEPSRTPDDGSETKLPEDGGDHDADDALNDDRTPAEVVDDINRPVLLFDGVCNLCNGTIRAVVRLDRDGAVLFAPLQSKVGQELLERAELSPEYFDSVVLVEPPTPRTGAAGEGGGWTASTKSEAVLRVCRRLDGPVPLLSLLVYLPEGLRDGVYDLVAEHRYRIFGRQDECPIPDERTRERFVERSLA
jgi:predicted DCC family thiol-disulfide oxidoreductase YuxK